MPYMLVRHRVKDFGAWKRAFDKHGTERAAAGCRGGLLLRVEGDPNDIVIQHEWDSLEKARKFAASKELKSAIEAAGVIGQPEIWFLEEIEAFAK